MQQTDSLSQRKVFLHWYATDEYVVVEVATMMCFLATLVHAVAMPLKVSPHPYISSSHADGATWMPTGDRTSLYRALCQRQG